MCALRISLANFLTSLLENLLMQKLTIEIWQKSKADSQEFITRKRKTSQIISLSKNKTSKIIL